MCAPGDACKEVGKRRHLVALANNGGDLYGLADARVLEPDMRAMSAMRKKHVHTVVSHHHNETNKNELERGVSTDVRIVGQNGQDGTHEAATPAVRVHVQQHGRERVRRPAVDAALDRAREQLVQEEKARAVLAAIQGLFLDEEFVAPLDREESADGRDALVRNLQLLPVVLGCLQRGSEGRREGERAGERGEGEGE